MTLVGGGIQGNSALFLCANRRHSYCVIRCGEEVSFSLLFSGVVVLEDGE